MHRIQNGWNRTAVVTLYRWCTPVIDIAGRSNLRLAQRGDMFVPRTRTEFGRRSFHVAAPAVWNALTTHLHSTTISRGQFRAGLKTYLFNLAFYTDSLWELLLKSVLIYLLMNGDVIEIIVLITVAAVE